MRQWSGQVSRGGAPGRRAPSSIGLRIDGVRLGVAARSTTMSSFGSPAASYSRTPWRQLMSRSSWGDEEERPRRDRATSGSGRASERARAEARPLTIAAPRTRPAGSRPRASDWRPGGGAPRRAHRRRPPRPAGPARRRWPSRRPCSRRTAPIGPRPRPSGSARRPHVAPLVRAERHVAGAAAAVAAEVELEDVVPVWSHGTNAASSGKRWPLKPCSTITAVRVSRPAGTSQPESVTPSSVVNRAVLVLEADVLGGGASAPVPLGIERPHLRAGRARASREPRRTQGRRRDRGRRAPADAEDARDHPPNRSAGRPRRRSPPVTDRLAHRLADRPRQLDSSIGTIHFVLSPRPAP